APLPARGYRLPERCPVTCGTAARSLRWPLRSLQAARRGPVHGGFVAGAGVRTAAAVVGSTEPGVPAAVPGAGDLAERLCTGQWLRIVVCSWRDLAHPSAGGPRCTRSGWGPPGWPARCSARPFPDTPRSGEVPWYALGSDHVLAAPWIAQEIGVEPDPHREMWTKERGW
nr:hypothetical protein [Actinomycetota bacterium]